MTRVPGIVVALAPAHAGTALSPSRGPTTDSGFRGNDMEDYDALHAGRSGTWT